MYALASAGHRRSAGSVCVLCAALAACQGVGCTPWRRLGTGALPVACACCVRRLLLAKGCTPWRRLGTGALPVAFACCVRRLLLAKGSDVRPGVGWAPALWRSAGGICVLRAALAACQGVGCTPWRRLGTGALPVAFARCARRLLLAKGSDVRPGVGWAPALCR